MSLKRLALTFVIVVSLSFAVGHAQVRTDAIDAAFQKFWNAKSPKEAEQQVNPLVKTGVSFDDALRRLKAGRPYKAQQAGVVVKLSNRTADGVEHWFSVNVPAGYDPTHRYQLRFQLHGGVNGRTTNEPRGDGSIGNLAGAEQFYVLPYSWTDAPWWSDDQVMNLEAIVDAVKRTYNIDENRVVLSGVSDGATGALYIAMRETTPFASILPLNGFIMVLSNDDIDDGRIFPNNLRNKPLFAVNGGRDPLYPTRAVEPFLFHLKTKGVSIDYHPQPEAAHNTQWWPDVKGIYEDFVAGHPRYPYPDALTWETADTINNRAHWLIIDQLGSTSGESTDLSDANIMSTTDEFSSQRGRSVALFIRPQQSGRVDLVRNGNAIEAKTLGVSAFTLLLSPEMIDFDQPVKVVANGKEVFNGRVQRKIETLLKWAARDNDRTMLYGAELQIRLKQ
jgi:predicted esterase